MDDYQRSKLKSYRNTLAVFDRYPDQAAAVPALARAVAWVRERVAEVEQAAEDQAGYAPRGRAKAADRQALADAAVPVAQALAAKADEDGDEAAADLYDFTASDFIRGPEQDALDRAGVVLAGARAEDPAALAEYGAEAADVDALAAAHAAFAEVLSEPRDAIIERQAHSEIIERLIPAIGQRLRKRVDRMMTRYRRTPFGDEYTAARRVVDPAGGRGRSSSPSDEPEG